METTVGDKSYHKKARKKSLLLGIGCSLITGLMLLAGLWPFNFNPVNKVAWLPETKGVRFYGQGIVMPSEPEDFQRSFTGNGTISIEFMIRPEQEKTDYIAPILTFLDDSGKETFIFGQWKSHLILRSLLKNKTGRERYYEWGLKSVLRKNTVRLVTITSGPKSTVVYLDGVRKSTYPGNLLFPAYQRNLGNVIIGTSRTGETYWQGSLLGFAIYGRTLNGQQVRDHSKTWRQEEPGTAAPGKNEAASRHNTGKAPKPLHPSRPGGSTSLDPAAEEVKPIALYLFDDRGGPVIRNQAGGKNHLLIPPVFQPIRRTFLGTPPRDQWFTRWNLTDILINICGFIPFGLFLTAWLRQAHPAGRALHSYGIAILSGCCLSLCIELTQVYLPMRDSSRLDIVSNTLGTASGALLYKYYVDILKRVWERMAVRS